MHVNPFYNDLLYMTTIMCMGALIFGKFPFCNINTILIYNLWQIFCVVVMYMGTFIFGTLLSEVETAVEVEVLESQLPMKSTV